MIRLITTTRSRRFVLIASAIICFAYVDAVVAQKLEPIPPANVAGESPDQIKQIYKLTKAASKIEDYELIIQRCQKQLKQTLKSKDHKYLESLIVWSNNRIGQQHFQNSVSMKETGLNRQAEEELQRAIHIFDELISDSPLTWRAWFNRARIHAMRGEFEPALEKFIEVTKLKRDHPAAWFNAAEICLQLNRNEEAIEFYSRSIKMDPTDVQALTGRGHASLASKEFLNAIADYKTVIKLQPSDEFALSNLADAYFATEMWDEARLHYESAAKTENATLGKVRLANFLIGCGDKKQRDSKRAVTLAKQAVETAGPSVPFLTILAAAYSANGQNDMAKQTQKLRESLELRAARKQEPITK